MDPSQIPQDVMRVLQSPELSMAKKMMAFNMLIPNLPADPKHTEAYNNNLKVGDKLSVLWMRGRSP